MGCHEDFQLIAGHIEQSGWVKLHRN